MHEELIMGADWRCIRRYTQSNTLPCPTGGPFGLERLPGSALDRHQRHRR